MIKKRQYLELRGVLEPMRLILVLCVLISFNAVSQREKPKNYARFDEKLIHFGFMLGGNTSTFALTVKEDAFANYGLKSLTTNSGIGGQLGIVSTMKLGTPVVRLRLIPTLSFQERILHYTFVNPDTTSTSDLINEQRVNSTSLDFPLMFQFRTLRLNNFASYLLLGGQYSLDLQSQEDSAQDFSDPFVKIKKHDYSAQLGIGVEFFAPYFKFGMEIKYSHGLRNTFIPENTLVGDPISKLYNKTWWFSIIFEG